MVRLNNHHRRGCFKANTSFDTDYGITHMNVSADAIRSGNELKMLDCFRAVIKGTSIHFFEFTLMEMKFHFLAAGFCNLCWPCFFRKHSFRAECFPSTNACSPKSFIDRIHRFLCIHLYSMFCEIIDLLFPAEFQITDRRDDLHSGDHDVKNHIEPDLVVSGTGTSMSDSFSLMCFHMVGNVQSLAQPFCTHTERISIVLQYISENKKFQDTVVVIPNCMDSGM